MGNGHKPELSKIAPVHITAAVNHSMRPASRPTIMTRTASRALPAPVEARSAKGANSQLQRSLRCQASLLCVLTNQYITATPTVRISCTADTAIFLGPKILIPANSGDPT